MRVGRQPEYLLSKAHYRDASLYDKRYARRRDDVSFYANWARHARGRVLELGAGTGRLTVPMQATGAQVTALEREPALFAVLRKRAANAVKGDFTRALPSGRFALVVAPFNTFAHVFDGLADVLSRIRKQLGGHLVFDLPMPDPDVVRRDPERKYRVGFARIEGERYAYSESFDYDPAAQTLLTLAHYDRAGDPAHPQSFVLPLLQRLYFPQELAAIVAWAGLQLVSHHGDFTGGPITRDSVSQVVVCRS